VKLKRRVLQRDSVTAFLLDKFLRSAQTADIHCEQYGHATTVPVSPTASERRFVALPSLSAAAAQLWRESARRSVAQSDKPKDTMRTKTKILSGLVLTTFLFTSQAGAQLVYFNNFQGAVAIEWSSRATEAPPADANRIFLGRFADGTVSLSLSALPAHSSLSLDFDLFIMSSWDGDGPEPGTPDIWSLSVAGGPTLVHTTFSNFPNRTQDYPNAYDDVPGGAVNPPKTGAVEVNTLGYPGFLNFPGGDSVYHMQFDIPHTASSVMFNFVGGPGLTSVADESWGLDNVRVVAVAEPSTYVLLTVGFLLVVVLRGWRFMNPA
jgi:hypothetical protein